MNEQQDMPEQEAGSESILQKIVQLLDENRTDDLQSVIEGLSEEDLTHILESLDADHMPKFFGCLDKEAAADVFVLPSRYEGMPVVAAEGTAAFTARRRELTDGELFDEYYRSVYGADAEKELKTLFLEILGEAAP